MSSQNRKNNPKICMKTQKPLNNQNNLEGKKIELEQLGFLFRQHSYSNQSSMILAQNRHRYQWNNTESPEINPHTCGQLICDTEGKNMQ